MADDLERLRVEAEALGVKVDGRWGVERLRAEIDAVSDEPAPQEGAQSAAAVEPALTGEDNPDRLLFGRAGGYVNRGDGWVLDES